jgi:Protein of unknown function (DUF1552)
MRYELSRRSALRGMFGGAAVAVGVPLLDVFLDGNGQALAATGKPLPTRFGVWFWGLGVNPPRWYPDKAGANYDLKVELEPIAPLQHKINILGDYGIPLDGHPNIPHQSGGVAIRTGQTLASGGGGLPAPSFDVLISDVIGTKTRFRSLEISGVGGSRNTLSGRGNGNMNPAEGSPLALYTRVFGPGFKDPNSATFTPDPVVMARRSVLSSVTDDRKALEARLGASDKQRLEQYFTSLRQLEKQLDVELTKPDPLEACVVPSKPADLKESSDVDTVITNNKIMTQLLVMALACDQTRVFNMNFNDGASSLTRVGSTVTHHQLTHEEPLDTRLGYQPECTFFINKIMAGWVDFVTALDSVKEGDGTLLDHMLVFAHSETEFAKFHSIDKIPMMTAGAANGRVKTGLYVPGGQSPISRVGLTLQQLMGVPVDKWGAGSMETNKPISEIVA